MAYKTLAGLGFTSGPEQIPNKWQRGTGGGARYRLPMPRHADAVNIGKHITVSPTPFPGLTAPDNGPRLGRA